MGARASADTTANAFSNLRNSTFELSAAIGESLAPATRGVTLALTNLFDGLTNFLEGSQFSRKSAEEFTQALSGTTASVRELLPELDEYIRQLEQQQRSRGGISSEQLAALNEARELYGVVSGAISGNTQSITELEARTATAKAELEAYNTEQTRLKAAIDAVDPSIRAERDSLVGLNEDLAANRQRIDEAQRTYTDLNNILMSVTEETTTLREGVSSVEPPTVELRTATVSLTESIRALPPEIAAVREGFDALAPTAQRVAEVFADVQTSFVDLEEEERALNLINSELHGGLTTTAVDLETLCA